MKCFKDVPFKKSPNKWTTWNKGKICQNCNRIGWRMSEKFSDNEMAVFYCIYCGMFFAKYNDFPIGELRRKFKAQLKSKTEKNDTPKN